MTKNDLKIRLKELGYTLKEFSELHGVSLSNIYHWNEVPKWAVYWVRMRHLEERLNRIGNAIRDI